jgi:hypothetical protein
MALTYQAFFKHELGTLIETEIDRMKDSLVTGHTALDYPHYKHQVGIIMGLYRALELVDEADRLANGGERN